MRGNWCGDQARYGIVLPLQQKSFLDCKRWEPASDALASVAWIRHEIPVPHARLHP